MIFIRRRKNERVSTIELIHEEFLHAVRNEKKASVQGKVWEEGRGRRKEMWHELLLTLAQVLLLVLPLLHTPYHRLGYHHSQHRLATAQIATSQNHSLLRTHMRIVHRKKERKKERKKTRTRNEDEDEDEKKEVSKLNHKIRQRSASPFLFFLLKEEICRPVLVLTRIILQ